MKKVFLLATTAVFMTTANAMAAEGDLPTSSMPVTFTLKKLSGITDIQSMKGGTITIDPRFVNDYDGTEFMDIVHFDRGMDSLANSPTVKVTGNEMGSFKTTDTLEDGDHFYVQGEGSSARGDCHVDGGEYCEFTEIELADGLRLANFEFIYNSSESKWSSWACLKASKAYLQDIGNYDEPKSYSITIGYDH